MPIGPASSRQLCKSSVISLIRPRSGNWKSWETNIGPDTVVLIHDIPRSLVESGSPDKSKVEIIPKESDYEDDVTQLAAARARLLARIAEIDAPLGAESSASQL